MSLHFPQKVSVPDSAALFTIFQTEQKHHSDRLSFMFEHSLCSQVCSARALIPNGACCFFSPTMMQVGHGCQSESATLTLLFVDVSTCRPPVLSQVLPRAHSASQGSVVAVHRMQDLQQLSRSREECGEWKSEYGGLSVCERSSLLKCRREMLIDISVVLGSSSYFSQPRHDFTVFSCQGRNGCYSNVC